MAGSNVLAQLGKPQMHPDFEGRFLQFGSGTPTDGTSSPQLGAGVGGLYVNTSCTSGANALFVNTGTAANPTWTNVTGES
tara:strand:+ start:1084 stop:1323 length:240 start_codon:yes stop_codon:yes gene_type:complete